MGYVNFLSERAKKLCSLLVAQENDGFLSDGLDDFSWVKWSIGSPAKRVHFLPGLQLQHDQIEAISLRACLEQAVQDGKLLNAEQVDCLKFGLPKILASASVDVHSDSRIFSVASELLTLLAQRPGPLRHIYASRGVSSDDVEPEAV